MNSTLPHSPTSLGTPLLNITAAEIYWTGLVMFIRNRVPIPRNYIYHGIAYYVYDPANTLTTLLGFPTNRDGSFEDVFVHHANELLLESFATYDSTAIASTVNLLIQRHEHACRLQPEKFNIPSARRITRRG